MANVAKMFEKMPESFQADKAGDMNATIYFDLAGEGGGQWVVHINDGACKVESGAPAEETTSTIRMDAQDYADMVTGKLNPITAFTMGKVRVEGDLNTVMKFQALFDLGG